ncbi:MAG: 30S ribosomal protein S4 [Bacilli bacterium]|nr:30S ribosomal protein S4 [Bacilli bacterium]
MRYTGPKWKRARRLGYSLLGTGEEFNGHTLKKGDKREYAPGQHGADKKKLSEYGRQLAEKQKLRDTYGVNERQFRKLFILATKSNEVTGTKFMSLLESRLDNLVYRLGFAATRRAARQLVNHKHILVNGKNINIPSYTCNVGDVISVKEASQDMVVVKAALEAQSVTVPYVEVEKEKFSGKFIRLPERSELPKDINESLIVEYYNRML